MNTRTYMVDVEEKKILCIFFNDKIHFYFMNILYFLQKFFQFLTNVEGFIKNFKVTSHLVLEVEVLYFDFGFNSMFVVVIAEILWY